jgi:hypothetical protein
MNVAPIRPRDLIEAGLYASEKEVIQASLAHLLEDCPELPLDLAIYEYDVKSGISLGRAAGLAGISRWELVVVRDADSAGNPHEFGIN